MTIVIAALFFVLFPAYLLRYEQRFRLIQWLSPAFFCYAGGIALGNIITIPAVLTDNFINTTVIIAIPLLLFQTDLKKTLQLAPKTLLAYLLWVIVIAFSASIGFYFMGSWVEEPAIMSGMATSVYIGGTQNMAAVNLALKANEQLFIEMNLSDLLLSGAYLIFLLSFGQRILLLFLSPFKKRAHDHSVEESTEKIQLLSELNLRQKAIKVGINILLGGIILGISVGLSYLISGKIDELIIILSLTVLGLLASTHEKIRNHPGSYETGEYLFLIFCVAVGAKVDLSLLLSSTPIILLYMVVIAYSALILHAILAYFFRIDADTTIMVSAAGIFGPPFIGPIANALKNREIVAAGMTLGVINMAVGNFMGILIYSLLT